MRKIAQGRDSGPRAEQIRRIADLDDAVARKGEPQEAANQQKDIAFARSSNDATILLAEDGDAIVATAMVGHDGHRGWVYYLCSAPTERGKGLGKLMLESAEKWLRERGLWKMQFLVRKENEAVMKIYEHLGYEKLDVVCMQKVIK